MISVHSLEARQLWINRTYVKLVERMSSASASGMGRTVWLLAEFTDGTTLTLADTPDNRTALGLGTTP